MLILVTIMFLPDAGALGPLPLCVRRFHNRELQFLAFLSCGFFALTSGLASFYQGTTPATPR